MPTYIYRELYLSVIPLATPQLSLLNKTAPFSKHNALIVLCFKDSALADCLNCCYSVSHCSGLAN